MLTRNPFISSEWILTIILFISHSAFSAGKRMKFEPFQKIPRTSQEHETQTSNPPGKKKKQREIIPPYIEGDIPDIAEEESVDKPPPLH